ncbi:MAG: hypothetical protein ABJC62_09525 [Frankiaceae bacterium]
MRQEASQPGNVELAEQMRRHRWNQKASWEDVQRDHICWVFAATLAR